MKKLIALFITLVIVQNSSAIETKSGTTAVPFLKISPAARVEGMGGAFVAEASDINALYYNPAGISLIENMQFIASHVSWFGGIKNEYLAFVLPMDNENAFGFSLTYHSVSGLSEFNSSGVETGQIAQYSISPSVSYSQLLMESLAVGITVKGLMEQLAGEQGSGMAVDAGILISLSSMFSIGAALQNLGPQYEFAGAKSSLPFNIKSGISFRPAETIKILLDNDLPNDSSMKIHIGAEILLNNQYFLRAGYQTIGEDGRLCLGFGYETAVSKKKSRKTVQGEKVLFFDYSYQTQNEIFEAANRISIGYKF